MRFATRISDSAAASGLHPPALLQLQLAQMPDSSRTRLNRPARSPRAMQPKGPACAVSSTRAAAAPPVDKAHGTSCSVSSDVAAGPLALRRLASPPLASPALAHRYWR